MEFIFLISSSRIGGAQYYVKRNAEFVSKYYKTSILYGKNEGNIFEQRENLAIEVIRGLHIPFNPLAVFLLVKKFRNKQERRFVCNSFGAGVNGRIAALFLNIPSIYVSHGWSYLYKGKISRLIAYWIERILGKIGFVLCIAEADMRTAKDQLHIRNERIFFARNRLFASLGSVSERAGSETGDLQKVVYVGRKEIPKRIDLYVNLAKSAPSVSFYLVGVEKEELDQYPDNLVVMGKIQNFSSYHEYDLFCLFSDSEGLPLSAIEAAASGIPLLLSDVGGCGELVRYKNGKLTENNDQAIFANFMDIKQDLALYKQRSENYRKKFIYDDLNDAANKRMFRFFLTRFN
jgi:glycosyltransferase involved in cell wall biosynthesis